jgi:hypothetical protein
VSDLQPVYPPGTLVRAQTFGWDEALFGDITEKDWARASGPRFVEGELSARWVSSWKYWQFTVGGEFVDERTIVPLGGSGALGWDSAELLWPKDTSWVRDRRRLQSWYRKEILCCPPGYDRARERFLGSLLPEPQGEQGYNFLYRDIAEYAMERARTVINEGGTLELDRLKRNMLSSMPMCFNILGHLRSGPSTAAEVLGKILGIPMTTIERMEVERAPRTKKAGGAGALLGDRTAFDAYIEYRAGDRRGFLGIETKFTDSFSPKVYGDNPSMAPQYVKYTSESYGWKPDAYDRVKASKTNQVWRNAMLGLALRETGDEHGGFDEGYVVVLACADDPGATKAVDAVNNQRTDDFLRRLTLEGLIEEAKEFQTLENWALEFERRYLDLTPVQ